jgi:hypothetical protein
MHSRTDQDVLMALLSEKVLHACEEAGVAEGRRLLMDWLVRSI